MKERRIDIPQILSRVTAVVVGAFWQGTNWDWGGRRSADTGKGSSPTPGEDLKASSRKRVQ